MSRQGRRLATWLALAMLAAGGATAQARPVRLAVLLDTSISMRVSDPQRLSILGVQLLGDLLQPGSDTLDVIPFDGSWRAPCGSPASGVMTTAAPAGSVFSARQPGDSVVFRQRLQSLGFDTPCTYFSPGVSRLLDLFPAQPARAGDEARVILILTDGASDAAEADRAQLSKLVPLAAAKGVRVWWVLLAAGNASGDMASVFGNVGLGGAVSAATANDLVGELTKVLTREAGWTEPLDVSVTKPSALALPPNLPLAQLVVLGPGGITDAAVELTEPQAGGTSIPWTPRGGPDSLINASVAPIAGAKGGNGYIRMRLRNPAPGSWRLRSKGPSGSVSRAFVIFHPDVDAELAYQDANLGRASRVPVGEQVCFNATIYSVGPSGRVALRGRALPFTPEVVLIDEQMQRPQARFLLGNQGTAGDKVADDEVWSACTVPLPAMAGRQYRSNVLVNYYQALNASGQAALNREGPVLQVLPRLRLSFSPAQIVEPRRLDDGDASCTEVELANGSELPAQSVRVNVMAWAGNNFGAIGAAKPLGEDPLPPPLENASISLDGQSLAAAGRPGLELTLSASDIGRRFRFCVQPGARHAGGSVGLTVGVTPIDRDYLRYATRPDGFTWQAEIVAPPFPWKATLIVVGVLLVIALALFATRVQRSFPRTLQIELYADGPLVGVAPQVRIPVAAAQSLADRLRGASRRLVRDDGVVEWGRRDQHWLGDLRAGGAHLFEFKTAVAAHQLDTFSGEVVAQHPASTWFAPMPGAPYRLGPAGSRVVVFGYRADAVEGGV